MPSSVAQKSNEKNGKTGYKKEEMIPLVFPKSQVSFPFATDDGVSRRNVLHFIVEVVSKVHAFNRGSYYAIESIIQVYWREGAHFAKKLIKSKNIL